MKALIGKQLIADLKPGLRPFEVRDSRLVGFLLRVQPSGALSFICEYARGRRITIGSVEIFSPAQARDQARDILANFRRGVDPRAKKEPVLLHTLKSFISDEYGPWYKQNRKRGDAEIDRLSRNYVEFWEFPLADITAWHIEKWRTARLKAGILPNTLNRDIAPLKTALNRAVEWGFLRENPLSRLKAARIDRTPVVRYLSAIEEKSLRDALMVREHRLKLARASGNRWRLARGYNLKSELTERYFADYLTPMVLLSLNTGIRRGELVALTWADIDLVQRTLTVRGNAAKSGQTRIVPLNDEACNVLGF